MRIHSSTQNFLSKSSVRDHLIGRHIDLDLHRPYIDEEERTATFLMWNLSGQLIGYQTYRPDADKAKKNHPREGRYFTYRRKDTLGVWGLESIELTPNVLFLTEGLFDAARITKRGVSAISALSNDPPRDLKNWLRCPNRKIVVVCDNDKAGMKLAKFGDVVITTESHDLGDSPEEFVEEILNSVLT